MTADRPPATIVVTGVDGFVGRHVSAIAAERGHRVIGVTRGPIHDAELRGLLIESIVVDLTREWPSGIACDAIVHLAGLAAVGPSFAEPQTYIETNSAMVTHMCEAMLRMRGQRPRIIGISSGAVYSSARATESIGELSPTATTSPYAVSKLLIETQLAYYATRALDIVVVRPFNHIGPGQGPGFLLPDLVAGLRALPAGEPLRVGDLSTARDYTDVRDVSRAYLMLAEAPTHLSDLYNVASGRSVTGREMLEHAAGALGMPVPPIFAEPARLRAGDARRIVGDAARLREEFGWRTRVPVAVSVRDFVDAAASTGIGSL